MSQRITIKQIPDSSAEAMGLGKYNRSKIPGTKHVVMAGVGPDNRWITGFDELALDVRQIEDDAQRKKEAERRKKLREKLEKETGYDLNSNTSNGFFDTFLIDLTSMKEINLENAEHRIAYEVAVANRDLAPSYEKANEPGYRRCKFYAHFEDDESKSVMSKLEIKDDAKAALVGLKKNEAHLKLIGRYLLPRKVTFDMSPSTIYVILSRFIEEESGKSVTNAEYFNTVAGMSKDELYTKVIFDTAVERRVITSAKGVFQRGTITYGTSHEEAIAYLNDDDNGGELQSIRRELEKEHAFKL